VLGSSLGGAMALALAQRHPGKLKSLIVVGGFSELDRAAELNFRLRLRLIEKLGMSGEVADYMGLWTLTRKFINSDAGYAVMRANQANILANSAESYGAFIEALLAWGRCQDGQEQEPKFTTLLGSIRAPTLVVTSDNDHLIPKELSELIAARIAGAKLVVMPGAGHIPFMEQPAEVVRIVLDFIDALRR
jgi:pimeloyl-ACP methyl ester carboxylesterase